MNPQVEVRDVTQITALVTRRPSQECLPVRVRLTPIKTIQMCGNSITCIIAFHCMHRQGQLYLLPSENMPRQFDHSKVSTAQCLVQIVESSDLPVMMTFKPRHCLRWTGEREAPFWCLLDSDQFSMSSEECRAVLFPPDLLSVFYCQRSTTRWLKWIFTEPFLLRCWRSSQFSPILWWPEKENGKREKESTISSSHWPYNTSINWYTTIEGILPNPKPEV